MEFKSGTAVLFNHHDSFFARMITLYNLKNYGFSKCVHAGIIAKVEKKGIWIYEPVNLKDGFIAYYYEKSWLEAKTKEGKVLFVKPNNYVKNIEKHCEKYQGIKYGILDILSIGLFWLTGFKFKTTGAKRLICSEAVARVLYDASDKKINFSEEYNKPYDLITPMDIYLSNQMEELN